ncbi:Gfo/Idh/MocA family protein [Streptomyces sp. NPDC058583]|uniref:Gfo/Idh/MocA family protein n=1 Tax=unclassified Streptomyces TaxID=2593676 RepID=UPI0036664EBE
MKIGLLGTGFAIAHAGVYANRPDTEVVVFGRSPEKLTVFADRFGFATTTDVGDIYADPAVDLVDVCLPTALHKEHVLRALAAGKHVLCELPIAPSVAEAEEICRAAEASEKQVFIDIFMRVHPAALPPSGSARTATEGNRAATSGAFWTCLAASPGAVTDQAGHDPLRCRRRRPAEHGSR